MPIKLFNPTKDPVPNRRYGDKPVSGVSTIQHLGNDYGWGEGDGVYAAADGTILAVNWVNNRATNNRAGGYGNNIQIDHGIIDGARWTTLYGHMPNSLPWVKVGQPVKASNQIGVMGNTGNAAGKHLHFELRRNGVIVDPNLYIVPGSLAGKGGSLAPLDEGPRVPVSPAKTTTPVPLVKEDIMAKVVRNSKTGWIGAVGIDYLVHISNKDDVKGALKFYEQTAALELTDAEFTTTMYLNLIPSDLHGKIGVRYYNGNRAR